jgi:predicted Zn-dependent protease with MMP-like domain
MNISYFRALGYENIFTIKSRIKIHFNEYPNHILIYTIDDTCAQFIMQTSDINKFIEVCIMYKILHYIFDKNIYKSDVLNYVNNKKITSGASNTVKHDFTEFFELNDVYYIKIDLTNSIFPLNTKIFLAELFEYQAYSQY